MKPEEAVEAAVREEFLRLASAVKKLPPSPADPLGPSISWWIMQTVQVELENQ